MREIYFNGERLVKIKDLTSAFTVEQALDYTLDAALHLFRDDLRGVVDTEEALQLAAGVRKLTSHLANHLFNLNITKIAAAKAALVSRLVLAEDQGASLTCPGARYQKWKRSALWFRTNPRAW